MITIADDLAAALDPTSIFRRAIGQPDPWQVQAMSAPGDLLLNCSRQSGKSTTTAARAVHRAVYHPGSLALCISPSQRQSTELFEKVGEVFRKAETGIAITAESAVRLKLANGSRVLSLPGSEATVRGFSAPDLILIDEAARVSDELYVALRPMLATVAAGSLVALSTPWGRRGFFCEAWHSSEPWTRLRVPATDCPRISAEFLDRERAAMSEWQFRQEYLCAFSANIEGAFDPDLIRAAVSVDVSSLFGRRAA